MQRKLPSLIELKPFSIIGFSIVFVCSALMWVYQLNTVVTEAQTQTLLKFEVSTPENSYLHLEPIPIDFKLSNQTSTPITWSGFLGPGEDINLISRSENGTEIRWIGQRASVDTPRPDPETTQPTMFFVKKNLLGQSLAKMLFPNPGRYQLRVEFTHRKSVNQQGQIDTIISNPMDIRIKSPHGIDLLAYQHLEMLNSLSSSNNLGNIVQTQQNFVNNFPNSVYRKYVAFELANNYMTLKDYEKAEREFYEISDIDFFYSEQVKWSLWELAGKLKRPTPRTKRPVVTPPIPSSTLGERPAPRPVPYPSNGPIMIPNPNANPNATPIRKPN